MSLLFPVICLVAWTVCNEQNVSFHFLPLSLSAANVTDVVLARAVSCLVLLSISTDNEEGLTFPNPSSLPHP